MNKKIILKFLSVFLTITVGGIIVLYYQDTLEKSWLYVLIALGISFIDSYWEFVHLPRSRRNATKKHLKPLEERGFVLGEKEYEGRHNNYSTSIGYFRNNDTKLPSLRIKVSYDFALEQSGFNRDSKSTYYSIEPSAIVAEYEISDMRTIVEEAILEFDMITSELNNLK